MTTTTTTTTTTSATANTATPLPALLKQEDLPLFVSAQPEGYTFGPEIHIHPQVIEKDKLLQHNALAGTVVTSRLYPLIWNNNNTTNNNNDLPAFRSLAYLQNLQPGDVEGLTDDQVTLVGASLRDVVFFYLTRGSSSTRTSGSSSHENDNDLENNDDDKDKDRGSEYKEIIESASHAMINNQAGSFVICGLRVTPWPTRFNKCIRWLDLPVPDEEHDDYDDAFEEHFVRSKEGLVLAFCDPHDISYHNVENVVNLERLFLPHNNNNEATLRVSNVTELCTEKDLQVFSFQIDPSTSLFDDLLGWDCYTPPFNSDQRGGDRFIFRSKRLSDTMTTALKQQDALECLGFDHVNQVFRLNRFQPRDAKFQSHLDIPFYDSLKQQRSKYTLLLYLTAGQAAAPDQSILRIGEDHHFDRVEKLQGLIFSHEYEHEGCPFVDSDKIFLRSELVCDISISSSSAADNNNDTDDGFDPKICKLFNVACHTALFHPELKEYTTKLFNHSVACRYKPSLLETQPPSYIHHFKVVNGIPYITNGHDFWFRKEHDNDSDSLKEAAIVALLDYFDGTYNKSQTFRNMRKICYPIDDELDDPLDDEEVLMVLYYRARNCAPQQTKTEELAGYGLLKDKRVPYCGCCCEYNCFHSSHCGFLNSYHFVEHFNYACRCVLHELEEASVAIFGGTIRIHTDDMMVSDDEIVFRTTGSQERIFFAACCNRDYPELRPFTMEPMETELFHVPPIRYSRVVEGGEGYHLSIDMFENGWTKTKSVEFPVPKKKVPKAYQTVDIA